MNNQSLKANLPLIVGILLPVIFIGIIAGLAWHGRSSIKPTHNFVYAALGPNGNFNPDFYANDYVVVDNKIVLKSRPIYNNINNPRPIPLEVGWPLYLYDVTNDSARALTLAEAQKLTLDPGPTSDDGYLVEYNYNNDGIFELFGSNGRNRGYVVRKGDTTKPLLGITSDRYYSGNFQFIGWVK